MSGDLSRLATALRGRLVRPGDPAYAFVRKRHIRHDRDLLPIAVAQCVNAADVAESVAYARRHALPFAIRAGGHSYADHSSTEGLLIDVTGLDRIEVTGEQAWIGAGARLGPLAEGLASYGRLLPTGTCPTVAVGGSALVGGFGLVGRAYGLTTDRVRAVRLVLADGRVRTADPDRHPELFWALRGAGAGNFGVVTDLVVDTVPIPALSAFSASWPIGYATTVIDGWQGYAPDAPDGVSGSLMLLAPSDLDEAPAIHLFGAVIGAPEVAARLVGELRAALGPPPERSCLRALDRRSAARYQAGLIDVTGQEAYLPQGPFDRPGHQFTRSEFHVEPLPSEAITELVAQLGRDRVFVEHRELEFAPWRGAYGRVEADATAFAHRGARFLIRHTVAVGSSGTEFRRAAARRWLAGSWGTVHPYGSGGVYPGYADPELTDWGAAYHGANLPRLRQVKAWYDPENVFTHPQSLTAR